MNTLGELMDMGFSESTAHLMLNSYRSHIGETHGCNTVTDVTYIGDGDRDIELTCSQCGAKYHKVFHQGVSKWHELRRTCSCNSSIKLPKPGIIRNDDFSYIGKVYGNWKVIEFAKYKHKNKDGNTILWICECTCCGKIGKHQPSEIKRGKKCQCQINAEREEKWIQEIGKKYGRLTVVSIEHRISGKNKKAYAVCNCECGGHVTCQISALRAGHTKSCGCIAEEFIQNAKDGRAEARTRSSLYSTWSGMIARCTKKNNNAYKNYGGRGIVVCDEWTGKEGFDRFEKWSYEHGYKPEAGLSLDRIDVNGNYEPSNCRYANIYIQAVNKRPSKRRSEKLYSINGVLKTKKQWCKEYNISTVAVDYRTRTLGMDFETALTTPKTRKGNVFAGQQYRERVADINKCNSYIEANLYLAFIRNTSSYDLVPQYRVGKYEADFWIKDTDFLVECDGYDAHKTKEQIAYDYERERALMKEGYRIIRFTGTEINKNPDNCCKEILDVLGARYENRQTNIG